MTNTLMVNILKSLELLTVTTNTRGYTTPFVYFPRLKINVDREHLEEVSCFLGIDM